MNPYDAVPYPSHAFPATAPDRLATVGALFGLHTPPPDRARVLELGSSSGGNLLPHAAAFPASEVLGLDLSELQVQLGQRTIAELGLSNARLEVADLATWEPEPGAWDYVICHGVYSWVPPEVQRAILRTCARALSPHGVAVVSWNSNPGWHIHGVVRDAMRFLVDPDAPLAHRAARAQDVLRVLAGVTTTGGEPSPHVRTLATLAGQLEQLPDSYVAHEYLEAHNQPLYLAEVTRHAAAAGLRYLCDSHLGDTLPQLHPPEIAARLQGLASSQIELEQYLDFLFCRPFRSSLLVRGDAPLRRDLGQVDLSGCWLALPEPPGPEEPPLSAALLRHVNAAWPGAVPFEEAALAAIHEVEGPSGTPSGPAGVGPPGAARAWATQYAQLTQAALTAFLRGTLRLHRHPQALPRRAGDRPTAWPYARRQAGRQHLVCNLWHDTRVLDPLDLLLLGWCDGAHTLDQLAARLAPVLEAWRRQQPTDRTTDPVAEVRARLDALAHQGLFVA